MTPELEAILICARIHNVASARRVNKQWRLIIAGSTVLQQKLFLKPFNQPMLIPSSKIVWQTPSKDLWAAMALVTDEYFLPKILRNPRMDKYVNHLEPLADKKKGKWMDTFVCQPPAIALLIWVKWDHDVVRDYLVGKKVE